MSSESMELAGRRIAGKLVPAAEIAGEDKEDTRLLKQMAKDAKAYILSFAWCKGIDGTYFGGGVGAYFPSSCSTFDQDERRWTRGYGIVVGDIPSAYLPLSDAASPREVFETYVDGMNRWVKLARKGDKKAAMPADVPPVNVPPTPEWADKLKVRLDTLEHDIRPFFMQ